MLAAPRLNVGNMLGSGSGQSRRNVGFSAHVGYVDRARGAEMLDYSLRALVRAGTLRLERSSRLALPQVQVPTRTHARCRLSFHRSPQAISARDTSISSGFPLQGRRNVENFLGATRRNVGTCWRRPAAEMLEKHVEHQGRALAATAKLASLPCHGAPDTIRQGARAGLHERVAAIGRARLQSSPSPPGYELVSLYQQ